MMKITKQHEHNLVVLSALLNGRDFSSIMSIAEAAKTFGVQEADLEYIADPALRELPKQLDELVFTLVQAFMLPEYALCYLKNKEELFELNRLTTMVRAGKLQVDNLRPWALSTLLQMKTMKSANVAIVDGIVKCSSQRQEELDEAIGIALNLMCYGSVTKSDYYSETIELLLNVVRQLGSADASYWAMVKRAVKAMATCRLPCTLVNFACLQFPDLYPFYSEFDKLAWWESALHTHIVTIDNGVAIRVPASDIASYV